MEKRFSISDALSKSFKLTLDNAFLLICSINFTRLAVYLGLGLLMILFSFNVMGPFASEPVYTFLGLAAPLLLVLTHAALDLGVIKISLNIVDTHTSKLSSLFSLFWYGIYYLVASFLFWAIIVSGFLMLIIPGIYFMMRFQFFGQYIADQKCGILESLSKSWQLTAGSAGDLFILSLILLGLKALGFLSLIGWLFILPFEGIVMAHVFRQLQASGKSSFSGNPYIV